MSNEELRDKAPDPLAEGSDLVRELVAVIEYLTFVDASSAYPGRFTDVREDVDVSDRVDPVLDRAKAFLIEAETAAPIDARYE